MVNLMVRYAPDGGVYPENRDALAMTPRQTQVNARGRRATAKQSHRAA